MSLQMWTTHYAGPAVHPIKRNGSAHVPVGTYQRSETERYWFAVSGCCSCGPIEHLAGLQHCVHGDGKLASHGDGRALEASALRALAIRGSQILHLRAIIDGEDGNFQNYDRAFHAQGLLYCATMNTATNDHIAQFVKGAHVLMAFAVVTFASGTVATGLQLTASPAPPIRAEVVGTVSLSPTDLTGLHSDIREVAGTLANLAAANSTEKQMKLLAERVAALEAEAISLRSLVRIAGDANSAHSRPPTPSYPAKARTKNPLL